MKVDENMLIVLMEECAEVSKECAEVGIRAAKILRFGAKEVQPGQIFTNIERLVAELHDLLGTIEYMIEEGLLNRDQVYAKTPKIKKFLDYSKGCGTVEDPCSTSA